MFQHGCVGRTKARAIDAKQLKTRSVLTLELLSKELQKLEMKNEIQHKVK